ncbi:MAG: inositol monophosphatase family protein [Henriciella sp.]|nr:inositol monophosphatase family protein [Henriciella sp.]
MSKPSALGNVIIEAARKAGRSLARDFGEVEYLQVSKKGPGDFVSNADHRAEEIIYESLTKARPGYGFVMEERGVVEGSDKSNRFIVDPLDGTLNFLHGQPHYAVSIALEREGKLYSGVVYDVARNEIFWGETGRGAWLDQRKLRVAGRSKMETSVFATGTPWVGKADGVHTQFAAEIAAMTPVVAGIRRHGSAALDLAWVAAGRFDGFWERGLKPWDIAAGMILVREAGGLTTEIDGGDPLVTGSIVSANEALHGQLERRLRKAGAFTPNVD